MLFSPLNCSFSFYLNFFHLLSFKIDAKISRFTPSKMGWQNHARYYLKLFLNFNSYFVAGMCKRMEVWTEQTGITIFIYSQLFFCLIVGFLFRTKIRKKCSSNSSSSFFTESYWKSSENNHFWFLLFCFLFGKYQNFAIQKKQLPETLITTVKTASNN